MHVVRSRVCCEPRTLTGALAVAFCPRTAVRRLRICLALDLRSTLRTLRLRPVRPAPPARDAIPGFRPDRPFRPVRPALSLAPPTRRSVACDRRARVRMRVNAGTYPAATNTHPRQLQIHHLPATPHAHHPSHCGVRLRAGLTGRKRSWAADARGPEVRKGR